MVNSIIEEFGFQCENWLRTGYGLWQNVLEFVRNNFKWDLRGNSHLVFGK